MIKTSLEWGHSHHDGIGIVKGGPGNDTLEGRHNSDFISGGDGDDCQVYSSRSQCVS